MQTSYHPAIKLIHWLTVGLLAVAIGLIWSAEDLDSGAAKAAIVGLHKSIGMTLLVLTVLRFALRTAVPLPPLPGGMAVYERWLARLVQYGFYALLIVLPLVGWVMSNAAGHPVQIYGLFALPSLTGPDRALAHELSELHETLAYALLVLAGLHAIAALKHHFLGRNGVLRSMLPRFG